MARSAKELGIGPGKRLSGVGRQPMMEGPMIKPDIDALGVQERVLLFCLATETDWKQAGVTFKTAAGMVGKGLVRPLVGPLVIPGGALALTDAGRAVLRALLREL